ncbi:LysR family transcriptional regulator [Clostridium oryzae]|uniref:HTH-type transcriptional regulator GltC n=1 Tax=Clostridium oryzae TaxID=1450648 RepID=A0A1V4IL32_9CLOT|nr:LysR family transcriptional regulator [Clostridium oryzae]OPJ60748.1 HTH-type transcriptional regulator GltC [Clostridium oryzae]
MEFEQLKYFLTIVKYKSFTLAAYELCISQSSLSKRIKSLEQELGVQLFDRTTRNISLTAFGEEFIGFSTRATGEYDQMVFKLKKHIELTHKSIIIGAAPVVNYYMISSLISAYKNSFPYIKIEFIQKKNKELIKMLKENQVDVAFFLTDSMESKYFNIYPVIYDRVVAVVDLKHPLVKKECITFSDVKDEKFIFFEPAAGMNGTVIDLCRQTGFTPNILYNCTQVDTMLGLAAEGLGVAIIMEKAVNYFNNPRIKVLHFEKDITASMVLAINAKTKLSKTVVDFRNFSLKWINRNTL